ncbi:lipocalin-like domain-containing protein [Dysgonomonas sp. PH5-45]|nr:lipocalin-like domain-containing protein [Dysgonomonas sp. PH5-45]
MKRVLYLCLGLLFLLVSCNDDSEHRMNGMWQLKTVEDTNGNTTHVDTVYYSFQRQAVFSFTHLINENEAEVYYGYVDFPADDKVQISIDQRYRVDDFLKYSGWTDFDNTFIIKKVDGKRLVLLSEVDKKTYTFKKY